MNSIIGILDKSDYNEDWNFINFQIDGYWLDEKLEELYPNNLYKGLIPTLTYGMEREDEKQVVWNRILPNSRQTTICPILMCPDDCDFSCIIIVAEIQHCGSSIKWNRIGVDQTKEYVAEKIGSQVTWLDKIGPFNFHNTDYLNMIDTFKATYELDKLKA